jgi:tRNA threonylcarbamoyladenosine biosynthesis protein TsaE
MFAVISHSPDDTWELAKRLAPKLSAGDVISLSGDLGAGKTVFTKGLAEGLDITEPVTSPTFTILKEYRGRLPLFHFDVYRLGHPDELDELGVDECFYSDGVSVVEWGDKVSALIPEEHLDIKMVRLVDDDFRRLEITPRGSSWRKRVEQWLTGV